MGPRARRSRCLAATLAAHVVNGPAGVRTHGPHRYTSRERAKSGRTPPPQRGHDAALQASFGAGDGDSDGVFRRWRRRRRRWRLRGARLCSASPRAALSATTPGFTNDPVILIGLPNVSRSQPGALSATQLLRASNPRSRTSKRCRPSSTTIGSWPGQRPPCLAELFAPRTACPAIACP